MRARIETPDASECDQDQESFDDRVLDSHINANTQISAIKEGLAEQEDKKIRATNAYPGATNSVNSIHQRTWYLSMDRRASGFALRKDKTGRREWVSIQDQAILSSTKPFLVRGKELERSVITGRLAEEIMVDENVKGYLGRKGWRPVLE